MKVIIVAWLKDQPKRRFKERSVYDKVTKKLYDIFYNPKHWYSGFNDLVRKSELKQKEVKEFYDTVHTWRNCQKVI
jgi:hypothetical protein